MNKTKVPQDQRSGFAIASLILGLVSFFPLMGVLLGIGAIIFGIIALGKVRKDKVKGKLMAVFGIVLGFLGIAFTFVIYGSLFYFGFVAKNGPFAELKVEASQQILTQNAGQLELYKKSHGKYPISLSEMSKDKYSIFPVDHFLKPFYYKASSDGQSYELRSLGPDGKLNTPDDILPND